MLTKTIILTLLIVLWALFLFGGFLFYPYDHEKKRRMPVWTRLGSSITLVLFSWIWFGSTPEEFRLAIAIGMTFGLIGDIFMAQLFPVKDFVIGGIASFSIGHLAYLYGFSKIILETTGKGFPNWEIIGIWWCIASVGWFITVYYRSQPKFLHYAALPYAFLLSSTVAFTNGLFLSDKHFLITLIGAILFLISDLILAADLFKRTQFRYSNDLVWLLYGPGQMLIVCSKFIISAFK